MSPGKSAKHGWAAPLGAVHDLITHIGFYIAALCLAVIVCSYCYEVICRYFFSAPTTWASSMVSYMLCAMVFLVMPDLARQKAHIFISVVPDKMSTVNATRLQRLTRAVSGITCLFAAWFCLDVTLGQFANSISTVNEWRIPKWLLSALIPYGMLSTAIYFLRHALSNEPYQTSGAATS